MIGFFIHFRRCPRPMPPSAPMAKNYSASRKRAVTAFAVMAPLAVLIVGWSLQHQYGAAAWAIAGVYLLAMAPMLAIWLRFLRAWHTRHSTAAAPPLPPRGQAHWTNRR